MDDNIGRVLQDAYVGRNVHKYSPCVFMASPRWQRCINIPHLYATTLCL